MLQQLSNERYVDLSGSRGSQRPIDIGSMVDQQNEDRPLAAVDLDTTRYGPGAPKPPPRHVAGRDLPICIAPPARANATSASPPDRARITPEGGARPWNSVPNRREP